MKLFLSWSGGLSHRVAEAFGEWIPYVINATEPWLSSADIEAGSAWNAELQNQLRNCDFGVFFVTAKNQRATWLQFEFGALASRLDNASVCPYLIDMGSAQVSPGPFTQFQTSQADRLGTWNLVSTLNRRLGEKSLREDRLQVMFDRWWPDLEAKIADALTKDKSGKTPVRSQSSMTEEILVLIRRLNQRLDLKMWSMVHTGPEGALVKTAQHSADGFATEETGPSMVPSGTTLFPTAVLEWLERNEIPDAVIQTLSQLNPSTVTDLITVPRETLMELAETLTADMAYPADEVLTLSEMPADEVLKQSEMPADEVLKLSEMPADEVLKLSEMADATTNSLTDLPEGLWIALESMDYATLLTIAEMPKDIMQMLAHGPDDDVEGPGKGGQVSFSGR